MKKTSLSAKGRILLAALGLVRAGKPEFTESDLVIACWEKDPDIFGLRGYERRHPDSNIVKAVLCGKKGLVGTGYLERRDKKLLVTKVGLAEAEKVEQAGACYRVIPINRTQRRLPAAFRQPVAQLLALEVFRHHRIQATNKIGYEDALDWWGLVPRLFDMATFQLRARETTAFLAAVRQCVEEGECVLDSGQELRLADVSALQACDEYLRKTYTRRVEKETANQRTVA